MDREPICWANLRRIGFRFVSGHVDNKPHMICPVDRQLETGLEISESYRAGWIIWIRSDLSHSKCRFCFIRNAIYLDEVVKLIEAIQGSPVQEVEFDGAQFMESLSRESEECLRRYKEYCNDARFGRVPGGL